MARKMSRGGKAIGLFLGTMLLASWGWAGPARAADHAYCQQYATAAVKAQEENKRLKCGKWGARWHTDYGGHYNWCRGARFDQIRKEAQARQGALSLCRYMFSRCMKYAQSATAQQAENAKNRCGYSGAAWHSDFGKHYWWCFKAKEYEIDREHNRRFAALAECRAKVSGQHPCIVYARKAVAQQRENLRLGCGYWGFAWHENEDRHYNWCNGLRNFGTAQQEDYKRAAALAKCRKRKMGR